jgi:hypothetical protein
MFSLYEKRALRKDNSLFSKRKDSLAEQCLYVLQYHRRLRLPGVSGRKEPFSGWVEQIMRETPITAA